MRTFRGSETPKVSDADKVEALVAALEALEDPVGALRAALARI